MGVCKPVSAIVMTALMASGCVVGSEAEIDAGSVGMELQIAPGVTVETVNWEISNLLTGFKRTDSVNVKFSNTLQFQAGGIPSGNGYTIALAAISEDETFACAGSAAFKVTAAAVTTVSIILTCSSAPPDLGTIVVDGKTQICANLDSLSAAPLETAVETSIELAATASAGSLTPAFAWTAVAADDDDEPVGTFDDPTSPTPVFTCPATPGDVKITVAVSPSVPECQTVTSQSVVVTCSLLEPTFTNVYATIISERCVGCHRPGGSGVVVGKLDMSTQDAAHDNLVNVTAKGTGGGTSGITCASVMPPLVRVIPENAADSLLFDKVHSKLVGALAPCGSPMPLPAMALPLKATQIDLITAWIEAGALDD